MSIFIFNSEEYSFSASTDFEIKNFYSNSTITFRNPNLRSSIVLYGYPNFEFYKKLINTRQPKNIKIKEWEQSVSKMK